MIPVALRETIDGFLAIAPAAPGQVCTLVVDDADGNTNVRPEASTRREPVGTLPNGTTIVPVEQRGRWCRFRKLCGVRSGNSAVSGLILIVIEAGVTSQVLGAERGAVEA